MVDNRNTENLGSITEGIVQGFSTLSGELLLFFGYLLAVLLPLCYYKLFDRSDVSYDDHYILAGLSVFMAESLSVYYFQVPFFMLVVGVAIGVPLLSMISIRIHKQMIAKYP